MTPYASRTGTRRNLDALRAAGWHVLVSATGALRNEGLPYALDNGAWTAHQQKRPFDVAAFEKAITKLGDAAEWVVLPDVVFNGPASIDLGLRWLPRVLSATNVALLAVQNGIVPSDVRSFLGPRVGIFVGGDSAWKEQTTPTWAALGREVGCWVHVGRVNTRRRINICTSAGVDSFDGTSATRFAVTLPLLDAARRQVGLFV